MTLTRSRVRWLVAGMFALALALRVAASLLHPALFPDSQDYLTLAQHIVQGQPYVTQGMLAQRTPGYPVFLAAILALGGGVRAALLVQSVLGALTALVAWRIARRAGEGVGLIAALLVALDPLQVAFSAAVLTEVPFTLLFLLALWLVVLQIEQPRGWRWPAIGVVFGIAVLVRASVLYCLVPLLAWVLILQARRRGHAPGQTDVQKRGTPGKVRGGILGKTLPGCAIALLMTLLVLAPWLARNQRVFGSGWLRLSTLEGISLYESVYPGATGGPRQDVILKNPPLPARGLGEAQRDDYYAHAAWGYIRRDPLRIARLAAFKFARTWSPLFNAAEAQNRLLQAALFCWTVPIYLLAIIGIAKRRIRMGLAGVLIVPLLYFSLLHALFLGSVRYRVPLMPFVEIFSAAGVIALLARPRRAEARGQPQDAARV